MKSQDPEGILLFTNFLKDRNFTDITSTSNYERWDMNANYKGKYCYFELKKRPHPHDNKYNDTIIEKNKYDALSQIDSLNTPVYVVNIFNDGYLTVIPLQSPHEEQKLFAQKTNNWDRTRVPKTLISYPNEEKYLYRYEG